MSLGSLKIALPGLELLGLGNFMYLLLIDKNLFPQNMSGRTGVKKIEFFF